jgi:hypothetical protein
MSSKNHKEVHGNKRHVAKYCWHGTKKQVPKQVNKEKANRRFSKATQSAIRRRWGQYPIVDGDIISY